MYVRTLINVRSMSFSERHELRRSICAASTSAQVESFLFAFPYIDISEESLLSTNRTFQMFTDNFTIFVVMSTPAERSAL